MKNSTTTGILLIIGALGILIPYTILTIIFDYPNILRLETGLILTKFNEGGAQLIWTWWAFAVLGLPLLPAMVLLGKELEDKFSYVRWATSFGIIGLVVQMIGLLRWTFVVPILAENYVHGSGNKDAILITFQVIHQYGGVVLGEHLGQLFSIIWTIMMSLAFSKLKMFPKWLNMLGFISSAIYLLAQSELFATVLPNVYVIGWAGFIGSTLWILWLMLIGVKLLGIRK
jgi:hypothetical protein